MKKSILVVLIFTGLLYLSACSEEKETDTVFHVSFDEVAGFCNHAAIVSNTLSHSGLKCVQLNPDMVYGPTFSRKIGEVITFQPKRIKVRAYVRLDSPSSVVKLVCSIDNDSSKTIFWNALDSKSANLKAGNWEILEGVFEVAGKNQPGYKFNLYPMYDKGGNILVDDLTFSFE
ncbi:MAG: hypothetical protein JNL88_11700 [Bacteroidia bacterium]|nr:hypothetical protein [Bacteroidia bacterium]